jgi:hypothetical protein
MTSIGLVVDCPNCGIAVPVTICQSDKNGNAGKPMARVSPSTYWRRDADLAVSIRTVHSLSGSPSCSAGLILWHAYHHHCLVLAFLYCLHLHLYPHHCLVLIFLYYLLLQSLLWVHSCRRILHMDHLSLRAEGRVNVVPIVLTTYVDDRVHFNALKASVLCTASRMEAAHSIQHPHQTSRSSILACLMLMASDTMIFTKPCQRPLLLRALKHHHCFLLTSHLCMTF